MEKASLLLFSRILLILCGTTLIDGTHNGGAAEYSKLKGDGWLKFHRSPKNWHDAALTCFHEDAVLASPLNECIGDALIMMMLKHGLTKSPIYTGIHNKHFQSVYQSMEGVSISDMALTWSSKPSGLSTENCIVMNFDGSVGQTLCTENLHFACYKNKPGNKVNECGTTDEEYVLHKETGSCYKYHQNKQDWSNAFRICASEGGHLAIINSQAEVEVIKGLARQYMQQDRPISIGFRDWSEHKTWMTIHGQSLHAAGYSKWFRGEPNNSTEYGPGEFCGGVWMTLDPYNDSILNDVSCHSEVYPFICEIKPTRDDQYYDLNHYLN